MSGRVGVEQTPDIEAAVVEMLAAHREDRAYPDTCLCEPEAALEDERVGHYAAHVAQTLAPVLAAAVREARAAELREAADDQEFWLIDAMDGEFLIVDCGHIGHENGVGIYAAHPSDLTRWVAQHLRDRADRIAVDAPEGGA